jgi:hypothetical protein
MLSTRKLAAVGAVIIVAASAIALAETMPDHQSMGPDHQHMMQSGQHPMGPGHMQQMMQSGQHAMGPDQMQEMMRHHQGMKLMGGQAGMHRASTAPMMPGQDAFGAIQEVVRVLDADPKTDWSKVDLEALRQHLIDMNEVTLKSDAVAQPIDGGLEVTVTGNSRTLVAIQRMIPAYAQTVNGLNGWTAKAETLPNGELLIVTATDPKEVQHIRGLGFIGLLASGSHHQPHHLAMAKSEFDHEHLGHTH